MKPSRPICFPHRPGSAMVEATMAVAITVAALLGVMQLLAVVGQERRDADQRRAAVREVANVMEQLLARPWSEIATERLAGFEPTAECLRVTPSARLRVDVTDEADLESVKRIRVELDWLDRAGRRGEPVRLVAWKFRPEKVAP